MDIWQKFVMAEKASNKINCEVNFFTQKVNSILEKNFESLVHLNGCEITSQICHREGSVAVHHKKNLNRMVLTVVIIDYINYTSSSLKVFTRC